MSDTRKRNNNSEKRARKLLNDVEIAGLLDSDSDDLDELMGGGGGEDLLPSDDVDQGKGKH